MKTCTKCGVEKPLDQFSITKETGRPISDCKACRAAATRAWGAKNRDAKRAADRAHYKANKDDLIAYQRKYRRENRPKLRAYFKQYRADKPHLFVQYRQRWTLANKHKRRAHSILAVAVKNGRISRPANCQECGHGGRIGGHHDDYAKPLDVRWLCGVCHRAADLQRQEAERKAG